VNRPPDPRPTRAELVPFDPVRHALQARIEHAKERLFADLDEAQRQLRRIAASTARGAVRTALTAGALLVGLVVVVVLARRRTRRLRLGWR
jgi:hypothetical protein